MITLRVELPESIDVRRSLEPFGRSGDDFIDRWDGTRLLRTLSVNGRFIPFRCDVPAGQVTSLPVSIEDPGDQDVAAEAVRGLFLSAPAEFQKLLAADSIIAELNQSLPGVRPVLQHDLFMALIRGISAQQVNLRWAATTRGRLARAFGDRLELSGEEVFGLNPNRLAATTQEQIRALQFTNRKAETIIGVAREFSDGRLSLESIRNLTDDEVIARLVKLKGIGLWSAEWVLCRTLGRPRVVAGDLGVRKVVGAAYMSDELPGEQEVRRLTAHWGQSAAVAQALLLYGYS